MRYSHQVLIDCQVPRAFEYMDDVSREHEWQPNIVEARKEPSGDTAVGTRKTYASEFMGKRIVNTYVTKVFEPNKHVVYDTTPDSVLQARAELHFEEVGDRTRVTMSFEGKVGGPLRFVPNGVLEKLYKKELVSTLGLLKKRLESVGD